MGTTAQKLQAIANSKAAIKSAIEAKGVSDVGDVLADYATKIGQISGGGSSGDPRYEVSEQGALSKKSFVLNYFNNVTSIPNYGLEYAYYRSNVTSASFPNVTSVGNNGLYNAFYQCTSLTSVDLSKVTSVTSSGMERAFYGCTSLTSVDLSSVTSVTSSGMERAFYDCTSLTTVLLKKLSSDASAFYQTFWGCTHLELVDFSEATAVPALNSTNAFGSTNNYYRIVVPNALYNQWIAATNWSDPSIVTHIEKAIKALTFKAGSANSTISLDAVGTPTSIDIEYSTDGGATFSPYTVGTTITLSNVNDEVLFRAGSTGNTALADDSSNYHKFTMSGSISIEDDISYLLNKNGVPETTALADYAFYGLFNGCSALQNAPELPWTTMGEGCYGHMFEGCTSITTAPALPATTLATGCYNEMFYGCSSLNHIELSYTGNFSTTYFNDWVYGVAASGTITYDGTDTTTGASAIPSGWSIVVDWTKKPLTFIAREANTTVSMAKVGSAPSISLQYSVDNGGTWNTFTVGTTTVTLANIGDRARFRATTTNTKTSNNYDNNYNKFVGTGSFDIAGSISSLLNKDFATAALGSLPS